jgi:hypothetical protein
VVPVGGFGGKYGVFPSAETSMSWLFWSMACPVMKAYTVGLVVQLASSICIVDVDMAVGCRV